MMSSYVYIIFYIHIIVINSKIITSCLIIVLHKTVVYNISI